MRRLTIEDHPDTLEELKKKYRERFALKFMQGCLDDMLSGKRVGLDSVKSHYDYFCDHALKTFMKAMAAQEFIRPEFYFEMVDMFVEDSIDEIRSMIC